MHNNFYDPFDSLDDKVLPSEEDLAEISFGVLELETILSDLMPFDREKDSYK